MATKPSAPASPTASPTSSPTGRTLSAAFAEDRRREARHRPVLLLPSRGGGGRPAQLMLRLHRWGAACLPRSGAAAALRASIPTPQRRPSSASTPPTAQVAARQDDRAAVSVAARRPLRESEEAADGRASTPAEPHDKPVTATELAAAAGESNGGRDTASTVGRGANIWVRVSRRPSPQPSVESPQLSVESLTAAEDKYVWADKYRPSVLKEFICNKGVADELHRLVTEHECNHFIFEGAQAVGKRSMALALLRDAFGPDELQIEERPKRIELKGEIAKHIDVKVKISSHHVEVNLADFHGYEKHVITTLLNESIPSPNTICDHTNCKVIVVHDADRISSDLQHYIGWFLGRYAGCNKIIFCCSDSSNLEAVKHLCKVVTLQPPSFDEIIKVLEFIATQESIDLPRGIASRIAVSASNNLRQAIRSFEATWKANYPFIEDQPILTGWEEEISNVAIKILEEPSPKQLYLIRGKIRKMIEHSVSPYFIFCVSSALHYVYVLYVISIVQPRSIFVRAHYCSFFPLSFEIQHLVTELKRGRDEDFQNSIDELASELNRCRDHKFQKEQCKEYKTRDTTLDMKDVNIEGFAVEGPDQGETIQCFIKIEEFTVRFMSFYRSLIAKNLSRGGVL